MSFPVSGTPGGGIENVNTLTHDIVVPTVANGDRLVIMLLTDGLVAPSGWPSGWLTLHSGALVTDGYLDIRYKPCDGTETSFQLTTPATQMSAHVIDRILTGTFDPAVAPAMATFFSGAATSTSFAPPALTAPWGVDDTGWRVCVAWDLGTQPLVGSQTNYTLVATQTTGSGQGGAVTVWRRDNPVLTENPAASLGVGTAARYVAATIAHKPAATGPAPVTGTLNQVLAPVTLAAAGSGATCVTSNFDGTETPLSEGGVWTNAIVGGFEKGAGFAQPTANVTHSYAAYTGRTWSADQSSKVTRGAASVLSGTRVSACVRMSNLGSGNIFGYIFEANDSINYMLIKLELGGTHTTLGIYAVAPTPTDVIKLTVVGTTLTPNVNGVPLAPVTDATYATGSPGIHALIFTPNTLIDAWEGCDVGAAVPVTGTLAKALDPVTLTAAGITGVAPPPATEIFPLWMIDARATWRNERRVRVFMGDVVPIAPSGGPPIGVLSQVLDPVTLVAVGTTPPPTGTLARVLDPITMVGIGVTGAVIAGALAQVLDPITMVGVGNTGAPVGAVIGIDMSGGMMAGMQRGLY